MFTTITSSQLSYSPTSIIASSTSSKQNNETSSELVFTTITSSQSSYSPTSIIASSISSTQNIDETLASYKLSFNLSTVSNFTKTWFTTSHNITESNNNAKSELGIIIGAIILIMMSIILLSAIILVVMIAVKRMKTKSQGKCSNFADIVIPEMLILFSSLSLSLSLSLSPSLCCISGFTLKPNKK